MTGLSLVLGGARSGKSRYAEQLAAACGPRVLYLATAEARDAELAERIRRHRERRPSSWCTLEAPLEPVHALQEAGDGWDAVLFECLSLWVSNLLLERPAADEDLSADAPRAEQEILGAVGRLLAWQGAQGAHLIVVSSEVGLGVVPPSPLGRIYRDALGRANQLIAAEAERLYYLVAGLGIELKALGASAVPPPL